MFPSGRAGQQSRCELLDHARQEKITLWPSCLSRDYLSAGKAGGTWLPMVTAVMWWFSQDRDRSHISAILDGQMWDSDGNGTYTRGSKLPLDTGTNYEDVTVRIEQEIIEAERLAKPHHFDKPGNGTGVPAGYLDKLRKIWKAAQQVPPNRRSDA